MSKKLLLVLLICIFCFSCGKKIEEGNTVKVHYTGKLNDGTVFDSSKEREPLEFKVGEGQVIPGFEQTVVGMKVGQSKIVTIPMADAYGPYNEQQVFTANRSRFPEGVIPEVGQQVQVSQQDGKQAVMRITEVTETSVKLDGNHPLAGKDLNFEIEIVEIN